MFRTSPLALLTLLLAVALIPAAPPREPAAAPPASPAFVDDDALYDQLFDKLETLAKENKTLSHKEFVARRKPGKAAVTPGKPGDKLLSPEEIYKAAVKSVFIVGSLYPKDGNWEVGTYATAWAIAADGVLVSNWHVFDEIKDGEVFGVSDREGNVYPVTDFLGGDKTADIAVFRIAAKDLTPLPVAPGYAEVGSWVGVVSHPGDLFYLYTQGTVTRYSTNKNDDGKRERWMGVTAEYASGSSGAPVLNKCGAVVGMAALTLSLDAVDEPEKGPKPEKPKEPARRKSLAAAKKLSRADQPKNQKGEKKAPPKPEPNPKGSPQQMVVKMAVPSPIILKWVQK